MRNTIVCWGAQANWKILFADRYVVQNYFKMLQYLYRAVKASQPAADYSSSDEPEDSTMGEEEEHLPSKRNRRHRHMTMVIPSDLTSAAL